ncbi:MAG: GLPGLI family protein, partial [Prevotella sp.]|nr:GLPGLI family protein [Prevotella sp.]
MMRMIILILLALIVRVTGGNAQSDVTKLSVTYEVHYQKVEEVAKREKDLMRLDIGEHSSQYVSVILEFVSKHKDDIMAKRIKNPYARYATLRDEVFKNTPNEGYMRFIHMPGWVSCREKMEGMFSWQLQD